MADPITSFNPTKGTWSQVANQQAFDEFQAGHLNSDRLIVQYDPIYNKLVEQIGKTMYRKLSVTQKWRNLGTNASANAYPSQIREIAMAQRKGFNFPMDNEVRPTELNCYNIYDDTIETRYHSAQYRWMYAWTIWDEELRRFSGGNGATIGELTEMKSINAINARNMFMDNLRKETLATMIGNVAVEENLGIDITDFDSLTQEQARKFLNELDNLMFTLETGSAKYNAMGNYMQTPKNELQLVIPYKYYMNIVRRAYPDMYHEEVFKNILPANVILIDTLGGETLVHNGNEVTPTFDAKGMNLMNWEQGDSFNQRNENVVACLMHKGVLGFEDNLSEVLFAPKDIEKLATPVRSHFWTKAYYTDLLPAIKITKNA